MREKNGWIIVDVVPEAIERAKAIRARRGAYNNELSNPQTPTLTPVRFWNKSEALFHHIAAIVSHP